MLAARQDGKLQSGMNPIKDITSDMGKLVSPITGAAKWVGNFAKEKLIDQKLSRRATKSDGGPIDYSSAKRSQNEDPSKATKTNTDAKKPDAGKDGDKGAKKGATKFGSKKPKNLGKEDANQTRTDTSKNTSSKTGVKEDASDKILSAKKKPTIGAHRKGATENISIAQKEANKGSSLSSKSTTGGTSTGASSTINQTDISGSGSSGFQRQDFTQSDYTTGSGSQTTTDGGFGSSTEHGGTGDTSTSSSSNIGADNQTSGMDSSSR